MGQGTPTLWIASREITITESRIHVKLREAGGIQEKLRKADKSSSETLHQRVNLTGSGMGEFERFTGGRFE